MNDDFVKRYWFLAALLCLIPVGLWAPGPGLYIKEQGHIIPVFVGLMLGLSGFSMDTSSLVRQAFNWRAPFNEPATSSSPSASMPAGLSH